ncbi:DEAD/DEAH box helicase family protein [Porticoccaceae bacterium LTM1]|nr:DEAD/DEAH box helicase family protein [Porticoccaceae bacterium LTM1]
MAACKIDPQLLRQAFTEVRGKQVLLQKRESIAINDQVADAIYRASMMAMDDVFEGRHHSAFKYVTAPTGTGKSTSSVAFAVAARGCSPKFTCAFVVETIRQCDEIYRELTRLLPPESVEDVVVWSGGHDRKADPEKVRDEHGITPAAQFHAVDLKSAPIIVCTHKKWLGEMERDVDNGVRYCNGLSRSLLFIDEHPDIVELIPKTPSDISKLKDTISRLDPEHEWLPLLTGIYCRMDSVFDSPGSDYVAIDLVKLEEAQKLTDDHIRKFFDVHGQGIQSLESAMETLKFIQACAEGYVFFSRKTPRTFVAYSPRFKHSAGYVLLDATADVTGMVALMPGMEEIPVPKVDYSNLSIRHINPPSRFQSIREVTGKLARAKEYCAWMKRVVLDSTIAGEKALLVVHKKLVEDYGIFPLSAEEDNTQDWEGRSINIITWGMGIGSNKYRECGHVFLFGEFFKPRSATLGTTLGTTQCRAADGNLKEEAHGRELKGDYRIIREGDLLRWTAQLAARGRVRNIDANGRCGQMTLHTSMDYHRLLSNLSRLFPGAETPVAADYSEAGDNKKPQERLIELLVSEDTPAVLSSVEVEALTGLRSGLLKSKLRTEKVSVFVQSYCWSVVPAEAIGKTGRANYLVRNCAA